MRGPVLRYVRRSNFVEDLVDEWKPHHDQAMFALDVEEFIYECIDLGRLSTHAWQCFRELLFKDPNAPIIEELGNIMKQTLGKTLGTFRTVQNLVNEATQKGHSIKNADQLGVTIQETARILESVEHLFMQPDPKRIEESIAAFNRGECMPAEELLRAAQDGRFP